MNRPPATPTIAVALHDGFYSCGTGAGRSNKAFLQTVIAHLAPAVRLVVLPIHLVPASSEYNPVWHHEMRDLVAQAGGHIIPVDNGTDGHRRFGGLDAFRHACSSTAAAIHQHLAPSSGPLLVVAFDCPFYGLAGELSPAVRGDVVAVARSTAALHDPHDTLRVEWEHAGLHQLVAAGGRVAAISAHMRTHLAGAYGIPAGAILDLPNGLIAADWHHIAAPDTRLLPAAARAGFILAMGRAVPYKGFDDLLDALALLRARGIRTPHTVLAAVTDDPHLTPYQQHLAERIHAHALDVTLLHRFDPGLRSLLTHPALGAVVVPSRAEPFGRIPLEAFVAGAAPVVATTAGGLTELVTPQTGFTARPADPESLAEAIARALAAGPMVRSRLRSAGRRLVRTRYRYDGTVRRFLGQVAPWARRSSAPPVAEPTGPAPVPPYG